MIKSGTSVTPFKYNGTNWSNGSPAPYTVNILHDRFWMYNSGPTGWMGKPNGYTDQGSEWMLYKFNQDIFPIDVPFWQSGFQRMGGPHFPTETWNYQALNDETAQNVMISMMNSSRSEAPTAIKLTNPAQPEVDLGTAIGETLTGGLPSLIGAASWKNKAQVARSSGDEYLNYQFGWLPLVSDIRDTAKVVSDLGRKVSEYESGSGKDQHRRFDFPEKVSYSVRTFQTSNPVWPTDTNTFINGGSTTIETTTRTRMWFSGCFRYYVPENKLARDAALADKFLGLDLNPEVIWNLTPWSWALDWQGNVGDVLANLSHLGPDATVMRYGYMMHERITTRTITSIVHSKTNSPLGGGPHRAVTVQTESFKTRVKGSPYSFSAQPAKLTAKQLAIVAALGLSRT